MDLLERRGFRIAVEACLGLFAAVLCWVAVSWAFRPGQFPVLDELGNMAPFVDGSYHYVVHLLPAWFYNDRPAGWIFTRLLFDLFGYDYTREVACFLVVHFANCLMAFALFRRLGVSTPLAFAGVALFGGLSTTAQTATYLGAPFDVFCLFFLLASTLALLWESRGSAILSAILFFAALRSKEFAIFAPLAFTVLVALRLPRMPVLRTCAALARRLWLHYLIALAIGLRYLSLYSIYRSGLTASNPYRMDLRPAVVLQSLAWYTSLIFGAEDSQWPLFPWLTAVALVALLGWAVLRRNAGIAFGICAFVLFLQPVSLMPHQRSPYYIYAPQLFLILALSLVAEAALAALRNRGRLRWIAAVCMALACLSWCVHFRRSPYFRDRVNWFVNVRRTCARSVLAAQQLPRMGPNTHVYVDHSDGTLPWLFLSPCAYLRVVNQQRTIDCVSQVPASQVLALYAADPGPKYLIDYNDDGSFTVAANR